jgi:hypothetical protein
MQALCCRLSDAAVGEVQLLVELYEHFQQRLVKKGVVPDLAYRTH